MTPFPTFEAIATANRASRRARQFWLLMAILAFAIVVRVRPLALDLRLHPDEAWFATFARAAATNGAWLLPGDLDKPPLAIYAQALSMTLFAAHPIDDNLIDVTIPQGEFTARLPGVFASIVTAAAVYAIARRAYPSRPTALWAFGLAAASPLAIAYSATAFTDGLMLLGVTAAMLAAVNRRAPLAGIALALAFACKPQALFAAPLIAALLMWARVPIVRVLIGLAAPIAAAYSAIALWDGARLSAGLAASGIWTLAAANNMPPGGWLVAADGWGARALSWLWIVRWLAGSPTLILLPAALITSIVALVRAVRTPSPDQAARQVRSFDAILIAWVIGYLALHTVGAFQLYDRYLLNLLPAVCLLCARGALALWNALQRFLPRGEVTMAAGAIVLAIAAGGWNASSGELEYGLSNAVLAEYAGIDELAAYLNARPLGAIVYDRWLGWPLGYYLGQWTDKRRVYYPTPEALAAGARAQADPAPRYLVAPIDEALTPWLEALREAGFTTARETQIARFVVYRLEW